MEGAFPDLLPDTRGLSEATRSLVDAYEKPLGTSKAGLCGVLEGWALVVDVSLPRHEASKLDGSVRVAPRSWCYSQAYGLVLGFVLQEATGNYRPDACTFAQIEALLDVGWSLGAARYLCSWEVLGMWAALDDSAPVDDSACR